MKFKEWFDAQPYGLKGAILGGLVSFFVGLLSIIILSGCHGVSFLFCSILIIPFLIAVPLARVFLSGGEIDYLNFGHMFLLLFINTFLWTAIGTLIGNTIQRIKSKKIK